MHPFSLAPPSSLREFTRPHATQPQSPRSNKLWGPGASVQPTVCQLHTDREYTRDERHFRKLRTLFKQALSSSLRFPSDPLSSMHYSLLNNCLLRSDKTKRNETKRRLKKKRRQKKKERKTSTPPRLANWSQATEENVSPLPPSVHLPPPRYNGPPS